MAYTAAEIHKLLGNTKFFSKGKKALVSTATKAYLHPFDPNITKFQTTKMALKIGKSQPKPAAQQQQEPAPTQVPKAQVKPLPTTDVHAAEVITKNGQATTTVPQVNELHVEGMQETVDQLQQIEGEIAAYLPKFKEAEKLRKQLFDQACEAGEELTDHVVRVLGTHVDFMVGLPVNSVVIKDLKGLIGALKGKLDDKNDLYKLVKVTLGDAKKYLSETELEPYIESKPGHRRTDGLQQHKDS